MSGERFSRFLASAVVALVMAGCPAPPGYYEQRFGPIDDLKPPLGYVAPGNIDDVKPGMKNTDVLRIMGNKPYHARVVSGEIVWVYPQGKVFIRESPGMFAINYTVIRVEGTAAPRPATLIATPSSGVDLQGGKTPQPATGLRAQRWAVVVGISKYQNAGKAGLANLVYADSDAEAFSAALKSQGWKESNVKVLTNEQATEKNVKIALESWLTKAGPDDLIVLFWSGHGYPDPEDPEKVYFACHDTDLSIPATGYRMDKVRAAIAEAKARNVLILADTCHAGKLVTRGDKGVGGISVEGYMQKLQRESTVPKGWIFMVSAEADRQAIEHTSWSNGAFTHCLLKGLAGAADGFESSGAKDGVITMGELRAYLSSAMPEETQKLLGVAKRPMIATSTGNPDIWNLAITGKSAPE